MHQHSNSFCMFSVKKKCVENSCCQLTGSFMLQRGKSILAVRIGFQSQHSWIFLLTLCYIICSFEASTYLSAMKAWNCLPCGLWWWINYVNYINYVNNVVYNCSLLLKFFPIILFYFDLLSQNYYSYCA